MILNPLNFITRLIAPPPGPWPRLGSISRGPLVGVQPEQPYRFKNR
jgi:hypothetical protein